MPVDERVYGSDYLSSLEVEFVSIEITGEQMPPCPHHVFLPTLKKPYFILDYGENKMIVSGPIKIQYRFKTDAEKKECMEEKLRYIMGLKGEINGT